MHRGRPTLTLDQILALGERTDEGCLLWPRSTNLHGYGKVMIHGHRWLVHRYVYTRLVGPIPEGLTLDHTCHNRAVQDGTCNSGECPHRRCFEATHLNPATQRDNWLNGRRGGTAWNRAKTHCKWGHPFDGENLIATDGRRRCRECGRRRLREYRARRKDI